MSYFDRNRSTRGFGVRKSATDELLRDASDAFDEGLRLGLQNAGVTMLDSSDGPESAPALPPYNEILAKAESADERLARERTVQFSDGISGQLYGGSGHERADVRGKASVKRPEVQQNLML